MREAFVWSSTPSGGTGRCRTTPDTGNAFFAAAVSVVTIWATVTLAPSALAVILFCVPLLWGLVRPFDFVVLVLPGLLPLLLVEAPGLSGRSGLAVALLALVLGTAIGVSRLQILPPWHLPRLVVVGWLWILVAEVISALTLGGADIFTMIAVRLVRTSIFFMAGLAISRLADIRRIAFGWLLFGGLMSVAAVMLQREYGSVLAVRGLAFPGAGSLGGSSAIVANLGYLAVASTWCTLSLGMRKSKRWAWLFASIAMAFAISSLYSGRRQAVVAFAGSAVLLLLSQRGRRRVAASVLLCLILGASAIVEPVQQFLAGRASVFAELEEGPGNTGYLPIYEAGVHAFLEHPLTGVGLGNYSLQTAAEGVWGPPSQGAGAAPHNAVIRVFAETGLMGGVGVVVLLVGILMIGIRAWHRLWLSKGGPLAMSLSGLGGLVLSGLSVSLLDDVGYCFVLGEFVGLCAYVARESQAREANAHRRPQHNSLALTRSGVRE